MVVIRIKMQKNKYGNRVKKVTCGWRVGSLFMVLLGVCFVGCDKKAEAPYVMPSAGLIQNQTFTMDGAGRLLNWNMLQHAGARSYSMTSHNQVLALERVGEEPWGAVSQSFKRKNLKALLGKTLEFSADISGSFTNEYGDPIKPVSLSVLVEGFPYGAKRMLGAQTLFSKNVPVASSAVTLDWQRYHIRFDMPAEKGVEVTAVELLLMTTLGGVMKIRGPSLRILE